MEYISNSYQKQPVYVVVQQVYKVSSNFDVMPPKPPKKKNQNKRKN
jgi:hypothetical protein